MSEGISVEDCFVFLKNCAHYHCIMPLIIPDDFLCSELLLCLKLSNSLLSHFSHILLFATLWIVARQAPLSRDSPGKNTVVGCPAFLQAIFPTQGSNPRLLCLLYCRRILYPLSYLGSFVFIGVSMVSLFPLNMGFL